MKLAAALLLAAAGACGQTYQKPGEQTGAKTVDEPREDPTSAPTAPPRAEVREELPEPAAAAPASGGGKASSVAQQWVDAHNKYRARHCAPPLTWSPKLADVAQAWANKLKKQGCAFEHSHGATYGENLAGGTSGALDIEASVAMWYGEVAKYRFPKGGFSMETGHFTQVVWTTTKQVGCGVVTCKNMDIIVCNYDPPGNWEGQYAEHVLPTSCKK